MSITAIPAIKKLIVGSLYFLYLRNYINFQDYGWFFDCESDFIRPVWFKGDQFPSLLATKSGNRKKKKRVNGYKGDVKGEYNVKKSKTLKSKRRYKKEQLQ